MRTIIDAMGEPLNVYELPGSEYDTRGSLAFESSMAVWRVRNYPRNWRSLSNPELLAIRSKL